MGTGYRVEKWREVYSPNPAMLRLILSNEGYQVYQWCDHPGSGYGWHKHPEDQTHWVISGSLEITLERSRPVVLEAGDRDFMPAATYHTARVVGDVPVFYLVGEKLPVKRKRGRPKKVKAAEKEPEAEVLPPELKMLLMRFTNEQDGE